MGIFGLKSGLLLGVQLPVWVINEFEKREWFQVGHLRLYCCLTLAFFPPLVYSWMMNSVQWEAGMTHDYLEWPGGKSVFV